jgi:glyoxylase-like metal-dependent hydrolase (beta-lactamase superfamily II)
VESIFNQAAIAHERPVQLSPLVRRITANNPSLLTGPGTNTYLVGMQDIAVIDPGSDDPAHLDAILKACNGRLKWVLVTHTHPDHSPGAKALHEATGAELIGNLIEDEDQDPSFRPLRGFKHDEIFATDEFRLRALLTPGHVENHVCYLLEEENMLFSGDHLMEGWTVVIIPPHGDMKDYLDSLQLLLRYPIDAIAPGHGHLILDPVREINTVARHRLMREAKVERVLAEKQHGTLETLTPPVYDDVPVERHRIARYSLWAHLLKLQRDGKAQERADGWHWLG